jgi:dihydroorotase
VDKGTLSPGKQADVTIFDPDARYTIDTSQFVSKSRNCPYHGWTVKGRVAYTIVGGEIRYQRPS